MARSSVAALPVSDVAMALPRLDTVISWSKKNPTATGCLSMQADKATVLLVGAT